MTDQDSLINRARTVLGRDYNLVQSSDVPMERILRAALNRAATLYSEAVARAECAKRDLASAEESAAFFAAEIEAVLAELPAPVPVKAAA